jgi:hypothetical protein
MPHQNLSENEKNLLEIQTTATTHLPALEALLSHASDYEKTIYPLNAALNTWRDYVNSKRKELMAKVSREPPTPLNLS